MCVEFSARDVAIAERASGAQAVEEPLDGRTGTREKRLGATERTARQMRLARGAQHLPALRALESARRQLEAHGTREFARRYSRALRDAFRTPEH